jgi:hypothetical protein
MVAWAGQALPRPSQNDGWSADAPFEQAGALH